MAFGFGDSILPNFVEQSFVTDLQQACGLLAIPVGLFERLPDGFAFGFIFGSASQRLQATVRFPPAAGGIGMSARPPPPSIRGCSSAAARFSSPRIK